MPDTNYFTRVYRITRIALHISVGLVAVVGIWPVVNKSRKLKITRWWCKCLLSCFNIQVITHGKLPASNTQATMFVANHISWTDIHAINSVIPLRFIAKSDVSNWPVFGYLVKNTGTLFIDRNRRKDASRIVDAATDSMLNGDNIGFFPEGTTTDGTHLLKFKSSIAQAAIDANAILWPIAIRCPLENGSVNTKIAYAGNTTMSESMLNILKQKKSVIELHFLAPISAGNGTRQNITQAAFETISKQLNF